MYIVKGKIKEYVFYGNQNLLRKGSPHFLPKTEVVLSHFYNSQYRFHQKLWVRGIHKSGLLKTKPVYFKFLTKLKLEEIGKPSKKTLEFIKLNKILTTGEINSVYSFSEVKKLLEYFEEVQEPEILKGEIQDELFFQAKEYLSKIQSLLKEKNFEAIFDNEFNFPIKIKRRRERGFEKFDKGEFLIKYKSEFCDRIGKSIIETDLETIFPSNERMIIGLAEIEISKGFEFKISRLEIE